MSVVSHLRQMLLAGAASCRRSQLNESRMALTGGSCTTAAFLPRPPRDPRPRPDTALSVESLLCVCAGRGRARGAGTPLGGRLFFMSSSESTSPPPGPPVLCSSANLSTSTSMTSSLVLRLFRYSCTAQVLLDKYSSTGTPRQVLLHKYSSTSTPRQVLLDRYSSTAHCAHLRCEAALHTDNVYAITETQLHKNIL